MEVGKKDIIYLSLRRHHQDDSRIKMGSDGSRFNVCCVMCVRMCVCVCVCARARALSVLAYPCLNLQFLS